MRNTKFMLGLLFSLLFYSASSFAQIFSIKARITGFPDGSEFSLTNFETREKIGTATIKASEFVIKGTLNQPTNLVLVTTLNNYKYYCFFLIGNENVKLTADITDLPFYARVTGSKYEDEYEILRKKNRAFDKLRDSISENVFELIKDTSSGGKQRIKEIAREQAYIDSITEKNAKEFIREHLNTYAGVFRLYLLKKKFSLDTMRIIYASLNEELKKSFYGATLSDYINGGNVLKVGDIRSDFEAQDVNGIKHKLSEIQGKLILLDFTETYCVPCVRSIEELKTIANKHRDDVDIISFCADKKKEIWLAGLKRDNPSWLYLWDGKGTTGETLSKYGVSGYPTFVLIDRKGKIVFKESGYSKGMLLKIIKEQLQN